MVSSYLKLDVCTILHALHYFIIYFLTLSPKQILYSSFNAFSKTSI